MSGIGHARHHAELAAKREAKKTGTPYVSGFCNPTLPRTEKYDPHSQCRVSGCTCTCHHKTPDAEASTVTPFEAGFYPDVPEADYHSGKFGPVEGSLSHSGAKTILKAPALFQWEREHPVHRNVFDFGSAAHALVLDRGMESIYVAPYDDWRTKAAQAEKEIGRAAGLSVILPKDWLVVCDMAEALSKNTLAMELLARGVPELSAYAVHEPTGIWRRCRFDYLTDDNIGVDYKSADNADPADFGRTAFKLGYFMQDPFYSGVAEGAGRPLRAFTFIVQEKDAPYLSSVVELDEDAVALGKARAEVALERYRDCTASGIWPGYQADGTYTRVSLPRYAFYDGDVA